MAFNNGVALMDWTRAMHKRLTEWFWVALSWRTESGRRVGINLSHGVYPHPLQPSTEGQAGLENGIWIDDRLIVVDAPLTVQGRPGGEYRSVVRGNAVSRPTHIRLSFRLSQSRLSIPPTISAFSLLIFGTPLASTQVS